MLQIDQNRKHVFHSNGNNKLWLIKISILIGPWKESWSHGINGSCEKFSKLCI